MGAWGRGKAGVCNRMTSILGINAYHGDAAAALVMDGELIGAVEEGSRSRSRAPSRSAARGSCTARSTTATTTTRRSRARSSTSTRR